MYNFCTCCVIFGHYRNEDDLKKDLICGTQYGIGKGKENTEKICNALGDKAYNTDTSVFTDKYAAKACMDFTLEYNEKTFDDWFLPSRAELIQLRDNLKDVEGFTYKKGSINSSEQGGYYWGNIDYSNPNSSRSDSAEVLPARRF